MAEVHSRARSFDAAAAYERGRPGWPAEALEIAARDAALAEFRGVLEHHGVREAELTYRTEITTARL